MYGFRRAIKDYRALLAAQDADEAIVASQREALDTDRIPINEFVSSDLALD